MRTTPIRLLVLLALLTGLAATACSGGDGGGRSEVASLEGASGEGGGETTTTTVDLQDAMLRYARCMRGEGVDFPDPDADGQLPYAPRARADATMRAAEEACEELRPEGRELSDEENAELYDGLLALAKCLRGEGFDVPDPTNGPDGVQFLIPGGGGSNPELQAAIETCREAEGGDGEGPSGIVGG